MSDDWLHCPECGSRIFRWTEDSIEVEHGAQVMNPLTRLDRAGVVEHAPNADAVAIAICPHGHQVAPGPPTD